MLLIVMKGIKKYNKIYKFIYYNDLNINRSKSIMPNVAYL